MNQINTNTSTYELKAFLAFFFYYSKRKLTNLKLTQLLNLFYLNYKSILVNIK